jgi:hypothetical protein
LPPILEHFADNAGSGERGEVLIAGVFKSVGGLGLFELLLRHHPATPRQALADSTAPTVANELRIEAEPGNPSVTPRDRSSEKADVSGRYSVAR